ncbi:aspartate aminotransferase family protein [Nitrosophilus kaiyonis]|uniref:aspartate aminotransferase family protein n=1 Tax=Nitrosophilus kaiyonis TaxID=2930200 RepID=UPI0024934CC3|nr:aspartate aminotransferase family protein [Nitrosophilus kaiyonis]
MTLKEMDLEYVLHTYARNYVNFKNGIDATLYDEEGKDYIDFTSGIGVVSVGHGNKRLSEAICEQAKNIIHISNLYLIEPQAILAKRLVELSGYDMRLFFANSGAEANEGAIKIARKYGEVDGEIKRYKIITLKHSFHGRTITALKATGQEAMHNYFGPFPDGFVYAENIDEIEKLIDEHTVAVMIELIQGEGGVEPQDKEKVQNLAKMLKEKDVLLIVDEVQTGIYRTGELLASNLYEIEPDIITLAKGLGGGVPIGAIMTSLKDIFKPGDHGSTFGGNYLSTRAANEVIDILEEYKNSGRLDELMIYFEDKLKEIAKRYENLFEKEVGIGFMRGLRAKSADIQSKLLQKSFENRVLVLKAGRNTVRFLPPLTISKDEINEGIERFEKAIKSLEQ